MTSSNPTAGGAAVGSGIGPTRITTVLGILKAYTTRVGSGPFPTELFDEFGAYLSKTGGEVGVTTGRARRCGWFDAVIARYATRVNGITDYFLTKLDVLSSLETVPVCVGYTIDGKRTNEMPMTQSDIASAVPIYEELPGWWEDISDRREFDDLPAKARDYVLRLEELAGAHVSCIGVGPGREQTIVRRDVLAPQVSDPGRPDTTGTAASRSSRPPSPGRVSSRSSPSMRRLQDLAVSADPDSDTWVDAAAKRVAELVALLEPFEAAEGVGPAGRMPTLPGAGSLLMPPFEIDHDGRRRASS